jgi:Zn-dependent protease with chaperone function
MKKSISILVLTIGYSYMLFAQNNAPFIPFKDDSLQLDLFKKGISENLKADLSKLDGDYKKEFAKIYKERFENVNELFTNKELLVTDEPQKYLQQLVKTIMAANPELGKRYTNVFFSRAYWPNAYSVGEGTIVFNIGLFTQLENESQMVFVLCHELSHLFLDHGNKAIDQYVTTVYADDFQTMLKKLKKQEYAQNKELNKLEKTIVFSSRRHSRAHEAEADSMAMMFMRNTKFDLKESIACLAILDNIDKESFDTEKGLPTMLNFTAFPFQKNWIKEENFFGALTDTIVDKKLEDSLKTHPDCSLRMAKLKPIIARFVNSGTQKFLTNDVAFKQFKQTFAYEILAYTFSRDQISRCLFIAMKMYMRNPNDLYTATMIGKCFNSLYEHQKTHTLNNAASLPSPKEEKNYNRLLLMIQNVRLQDFAAFSYYFLQQNESKFASDKEFAKTWSASKSNFKNQ